MKKWIKCGVVVIAAITTLIGWTTSAYAICDPGRGVYPNDGYPHQAFDGWEDDNNGDTGARSQITTAAATIPPYVPYADFANGGSDYAWPMLTRQDCPDGFVQVGQAEHWGGSDAVFWEVNGCTDGGANQMMWPSHVNENHTFTVNMNHIASTGHASNAYALIVDSTTINSGAVDFGNADDAQYYGETHARDDQQFGGVGATETFSSTNECYWNGTGFSCHNPVRWWGTSHRTSVDPNINPTWFGEDTTGGVMQIWDTACPT